MLRNVSVGIMNLPVELIFFKSILHTDRHKDEINHKDF